MKFNRLFIFIFGVVVLLLTVLMVYRPVKLPVAVEDKLYPQVVLPQVVLMSRPPVNKPLRLDEKLRNVTDDPKSPLAYLRKNGYSTKLPSLTELQKMETSSLWMTFHSYLDNMDIICDRKIRMGHVGDGGWEICDDPAVRPVKPCIIYSFGINNDYSFDDDAARLYGCNIYSFDPSMKQTTFKRNEQNWFYQMGIGGKDEKKDGWDIKTFSSIRKMLKHTDKVIDVMKIDVELAEWPTLEDMLKNGDLRSIRQLLIEFHLNWKTAPDTRKEVFDDLTAIKGIEDAGFKRFYVTKNARCKKATKMFPVKRTQCYEMHYINTHILP